MQPAVRHECIDDITERGILLPMQSILIVAFPVSTGCPPFIAGLSSCSIEWIIYLEALNYLSVVDMFDTNGPIVGLLVQALTLSHLHTYLRDVLFSCWLTKTVMPAVSDVCVSG